MARKGIIFSFNKTAGVGFIKDSNKQKIRFYAQDNQKMLSVNDLVSYEITMIKGRLTAVNITLIKPKFEELFKWIVKKEPKN